MMMNDSEKLRYIADWLDRVDRVADGEAFPELKQFGFGSPETDEDHEMQLDLRRIADYIEEPNAL